MRTGHHGVVVVILLVHLNVGEGTPFKGMCHEVWVVCLLILLKRRVSGVAARIRSDMNGVRAICSCGSCSWIDSIILVLDHARWEGRSLAVVVVMVGRVTSVEVSIAHIVVILAVWVEASCAHHELGVGVALTTAVVADVGS